MWCGGPTAPFASFSSRNPSSRRPKPRVPHEELQPPRGAENTRERSSPAGNPPGNSLPEGEIDAIVTVIELDIISITIIIISTIITAVSTAGHPFMDTDKFRNMSATYGLDSQVANLYKAFASHYELPKKNFDKYHEPYKDKIDSSINKCVVVETVDHVIPEAYIEKTPFPAKMKEYSVINSAVHKSEKKPVEPEEQIKVEPAVAIVKDLVTENVEDGHIIFCEDASNIVSHPNKPKQASVPMLSVRIGDHCYYGLCDIGASVSAIPYELYTEIMHEIGSCELEDIDVVIQLANRETISPIGIVRDVEVLCGKIKYPADFLVLGSAASNYCPIIFGRPFLNTCGAIIDCKKEKILTKFAGESYEFNFSKFTKTPYKADLPSDDFKMEQCASIVLVPNNPLQQHLEDSESEVFRKERDELEEIFLRQPILKHDLPVEDLGTTPPPKEDPVFDLKPLPDNLKYAHIDDKKIYPVIISSKLTEFEEERLENIAYDPVPVNDSFPNEQLAAIKVSSRDSPCFSAVPLANSGGRISADPPPPLRRAGATGPRVSTERPQPPSSPPPSQGSSSPFRLSWSTSSSSSTMASASGSWRGSYMREDDIERLVRLRRIPSAVVWRAPGEETEPAPEPGERVVFGAHLDRGLGLPASTFFRQFLDNFGLQPHHLPANACVLLSCYVAFMEAYAGLWPDIDFWSRLFYLKAQTTEGRLRACGAASIYTRPGTPFPKIPTVDSVKNWQMSFFYVRNEGQLVDRINLPEFNPAPPVGRINWSYNARTTDPDAEVNQLWDFLGAAVENGLTAEDLLCTIAERRVLPLQRRTHKIGHMSGRFDPNRTSKALLSKAQVASRVNNITKANMPDDWNYGLAPRDRDHPPERLFERQNAEDGDLATRRWTPDHVDPADQAGDQAGDDDLLQAPDLGGQGEHNPPPSPEQQEDEEPATSATGPIPAVPLRARPPSTTATSAPKGKKRASEPRSTPPWRRRRRSSAGSSRRRAPIKFAQGGGSRQAPRVASPPLRQRREPTPQPSSRAPTPPPPAGTAPSAGAPSFAVPLASAPDRGTRAEPTRQPTLDDMFPRRTHLLDPAAGAGRGMPPSTGAGAGRAAPPATGAGAGGAAPPATGAGARPSVVVLDESPEGAPQAPETAAPTGPSASPGAPPPPEPTTEEPARQEPARDEPARTEGADSRALVRTGAPSAPQQGLHVAKGAMLLHVPSASDSSLGSAGTMEQAWLRADSYEVTSREGNPGQASVEMFFSSLQANLKARAAEAAANVPRWRKPASLRWLTFLSGCLAVEAAKVPRLEADLRAARAQCAESEEAGRSATAKLKLAEQELTRLRLLEQNHLTELASLRTAEKEKVEDLSRRLTRWRSSGLRCRRRSPPTAFPETQDAALAAVGVARDSRRRATGEGSSEYFTMEDYMASMAARVEPITKLGWELRKAAEELVPMLWPGRRCRKISPISPP
ncbi:hypothetical protein QYE76_034956 [Lolium multiflorum]|uniref:Transposase (putative) gypsy type domain-containing protein n=1 Tax=Lolium multiflorum TaxID=4521 RepID=A0AAD8VNS1_LOLMU|nr:hypothetical protein QYE76_034956 [Lolium multiflorum]